MGWRNAVGGQALLKTDTFIQKVQNIQKPQERAESDPFVHSVPIVVRNQKIKTEPMTIQMESPILGRVAVEWSPSYPSRAVVGGVAYSQNELADLLRKGLSHADLQKIHEVKKQFGGEVVKHGSKK